MTPGCEDLLAELMKQRMALIAQTASGISEVEQAQLGRTVFRSIADIGTALRLLDSQIAAAAAACGVENPLARTRRTALHPVPEEC